jgi:hypothetical protein
MHKSATKCNETIGKWCKNKHGASKIIDTFETYHAVGWRSMYFVVMPRVNLIVILVTYARYLYSINCPTVICLSSMLLFILWRDTTSELWTPVQFFLHCYTIYFTRTVYFLAYYYCFPLDTLIPLFTSNRWDWQPHRKLGAKFLVVLCAGFTLLLVQSKARTRYLINCLELSRS